MTDEGTVMGTAGYMSPERVRGETADPRSDLFSFGVILYEMLGGKRAFAGGSSVEVMSAILKEDPPELPASVPPGLDSHRPPMPAEGPGTAIPNGCGPRLGASDSVSVPAACKGPAASDPVDMGRSRGGDVRGHCDCRLLIRGAFAAYRDCRDQVTSDICFR